MLPSQVPDCLRAHGRGLRAGLRHHCAHPQNSLLNDDLERQLAAAAAQEAALQQQEAAAQARDADLAARAAELAEREAEAAEAAQAAQSELKARRARVRLPDQAPAPPLLHTHPPLHAPVQARLRDRAIWPATFGLVSASVPVARTCIHVSAHARDASMEHICPAQPCVAQLIRSVQHPAAGQAIAQAEARLTEAEERLQQAERAQAAAEAKVGHQDALPRTRAGSACIPR